MKIGFDGKRAANNLTGLGNYSRSLIEQLAGYFPENTYFVYTPKIKSSGQIGAFFKLPGIHLCLPPSGTLLKALWRSIGIGRQLIKDNIDIYHGLSNEIPLQIPVGTKKVVTIHDLIYLRFPQHYRWTDRLIYNIKSKYACRHADLIIAISERTKEDIIHYYQTPADKIKVLYQSCDDSFKTLLPTDQRNAILSKYSLTTPSGEPVKYILNVGTIEARKNLLLIIRALPKIDTGYKLVVVGKKQAYAVQVAEEISELQLQDRIIFLENIPFTDLPAIYQGAALFIYPSFYEGFGIPVIEAMYSGIPVIAATGSCLEEAGGPDSIYISPDDPEALAEAANKVIQSAELTSQMISAGFKYLEKFNTAGLSSQLMFAYRDLIYKS